MQKINTHFQPNSLFNHPLLRWLAGIIIYLFVLQACNTQFESPSKDFNTPPPNSVVKKMTRLESFVNENNLEKADSVLDKHAIEFQSYDSTLLGRYYHMVGHLAYKNKENVKALFYYDKALEIASAQKLDTALFIIHYNKALYFKNSFAYDYAIPELKNAIRYTPSKGKDAARFEGQFTTLLAGLHNDNGNPDSALQLFNRVEQLAIQTKNPLYYSSGVNNHGFLLYKLGKLEEAEVKFKLAADIDPDSTIYREISENIGHIYRDRNNCEKAISFYLIALQNSEGWEQNIIRNSLNLSEMLQCTGRYEKARSYLDQIQKYLPQYKGVRKEEYTSRYHQGRMAQYAFYDQMQKYREEQLILDLYQTDQMKKIQTNLKEISRLMNQATQENLQTQVEIAHLETESIRSKNFFQSIVIWLLTLGVLSIIAFGYYIFRTRKRAFERKLELEKVQTELERTQRENLNLEIQNKKKDLQKLVLNNETKQSLTKNIHDHLYAISKMEANEGKTEMKKYLRELSYQISVGESLNFKTENIEEVNTQFLDNLVEQYPDLTRTEREICGLIRLDLPIKEMATLRNVSKDAIKMTQYRIRKKIGAKNADELYQILQKI